MSGEWVEGVNRWVFLCEESETLFWCAGRTLSCVGTCDSTADSCCIGWMGLLFKVRLNPLLSRFHFTTGKFPFEGDNFYKLFGSISTGVFEMPTDLSPLLQDLLKGLLRKDAKERLSIPEIRAHS